MTRIIKVISLAFLPFYIISDSSGTIIFTSKCIIVLSIVLAFIVALLAVVLVMTLRVVVTVWAVANPCYIKYSLPG